MMNGVSLGAAKTVVIKRIIIELVKGRRREPPFEYGERGDQSERNKHRNNAVFIVTKTLVCLIALDFNK